MPALDFSKWSPGGQHDALFPRRRPDAARQAELPGRPGVLTAWGRNSRFRLVEERRLRMAGR